MNGRFWIAAILTPVLLMNTLCADPLVLHDDPVQLNPEDDRLP